MDGTRTIAVVDDMAADRERLQAMVLDYAAAHGLPWQVRCFSSGEAFLERLEPEGFALVFLDILMGGMDGMETARRLRATDPEVPLVFVTTEAGYAVEGYEVESAGFLLKEESQQKRRFTQLMDRLAPRLRRDAVLELWENGLPLQIPAGAVRYAEVLDHDMRLHTRDGLLVLRMTMAELKPLLPQDGRFFECHRGIVINLDEVEDLGSQVVTMAGGDILPVSRRRRTELERSYAQRNIDRVRRTL